MKSFGKTAILVLFMSVSYLSIANDRQGEPETFKFDQYVMVSMKNGNEVPARILSVKSTKQYRIRMIGGSKIGLVHKKYLRKMTKEETMMYKKN